MVRVFVAMVLATLVGSSYGSPSLTPCTFACPAQDEAGFPLGRTQQDATTLNCDYPAIPGYFGDFYCIYGLVRSSYLAHAARLLTFHGQSGGTLQTDHNAGFCPPNAVQNCPTRKKRRGKGVPQPPRPAVRAEKPKFMKARSKLGKMKKRSE